jgi:hypothetical protein
MNLDRFFSSLIHIERMSEIINDLIPNELHVVCFFQYRLIIPRNISILYEFKVNIHRRRIVTSEAFPFGCKADTEYPY